MTTSSFAAELEERLIRYVQIDTTSDQMSATSPTFTKSGQVPLSANASM